MKQAFRIVIVLLNFYLVVATVCPAQENGDRESKRSPSKRVIAGLECSGGISDQPAPEVKMKLGDVTKKALKLPQPEYPRTAKTARIEGKVKVKVVIDVHTGRVVWARLHRGHPLLRKSALQAACGASFAPIFTESPPIKVSAFINYQVGKL